MFYRDFRDAARVFGRLQPAEDWERFLNNHTSMYSRYLYSLVSYDVIDFSGCQLSK